MKEIRNVAIVGMGALGLLFGQQIKKSGYDMYFLMDKERKERHEKEIYRINEKEIPFPIKSREEVTSQPDLMIVATKYGGLDGAMELMEGLVGADTIVISLLNGINSEELLAGRFGKVRVPGCIAIGMDAVREGTSLTYQNMGKLQIGALQEGQQDLVVRLAAFLEQACIPYEVCADIWRAMWNKFMINVGVNQTCMVYEANYGEVVAPGFRYDDMAAAMREVIAVANAQGIDLGEEDFAKAMEILRGLNPTGCPSMRQDAAAKRKSEVELFAGTMVKLGAAYGVKVPVNEKYYRVIREIESTYEEQRERG